MEGSRVESLGGSGGSRVREIREVREFGRFVSQEFGRSRGCDLVAILPSVTSLHLELSVPKLLLFIQQSPLNIYMRPPAPLFYLSKYNRTRRRRAACVSFVGVSVSSRCLCRDVLVSSLAHAMTAYLWLVWVY